MPRKARKYIIASGLLYHIVCRGNNRKRIFRAVRDYKKMLNILRDTKEKYPFYLYVYSLMPNHYHFIIETKDISNCSKNPFSIVASANNVVENT